MSSHYFVLVWGSFKWFQCYPSPPPPFKFSSIKKWWGGGCCLVYEYLYFDPCGKFVLWTSNFSQHNTGSSVQQINWIKNTDLVFATMTLSFQLIHVCLNVPKVNPLVRKTEIYNHCALYMKICYNKIQYILCVLYKNLVK